MGTVPVATNGTKAIILSQDVQQELIEWYFGAYMNDNTDTVGEFVQENLGQLLRINSTSKLNQVPVEDLEIYLKENGEVLQNNAYLVYTLMGKVVKSIIK